MAAYDETADAVDYPPSIEQLSKLRHSLRDQHERQIAQAEEAEHIAKMARQRATETGMICERLEAIEKEMSVKVQINPGMISGGTYVGPKVGYGVS